MDNNIKNILNAGMIFKIFIKPARYVIKKKKKKQCLHMKGYSQFS